MTAASEKERAETIGALTISKFCERYNISTPTYHRMKREGRGPREMCLAGRAIRISAKAEADWVRARENPTGAEAALIEKKKKQRHDNAKRAAASKRGA